MDPGPFTKALHPRDWRFVSSFFLGGYHPGHESAYQGASTRRGCSLGSPGAGEPGRVVPSRRFGTLRSCRGLAAAARNTKSPCKASRFGLYVINSVKVKETNGLVHSSGGLSQFDFERDWANKARLS